MNKTTTTHIGDYDLPVTLGYEYSPGRRGTMTQPPEYDECTLYEVLVKTTEGPVDIIDLLHGTVIDSLQTICDEAVGEEAVNYLEQKADYDRENYLERQRENRG